MNLKLQQQLHMLKSFRMNDEGCMMTQSRCQLLQIWPQMSEKHTLQRRYLPCPCTGMVMSSRLTSIGRHKSYRKTDCTIFTWTWALGSAMLPCWRVRKTKQGSSHIPASVRATIMCYLNTPWISLVSPMIDIHTKNRNICIIELT